MFLYLISCFIPFQLEQIDLNSSENGWIGWRHWESFPEFLFRDLLQVHVGVSWVEMERDLTVTFCSQILGLPALSQRRKWLETRTNLDYPFALPKRICTAFNKCCLWSSTSRYCSVLRTFDRNSANSVRRLLWTSFCLFFAVHEEEFCFYKRFSIGRQTIHFKSHMNLSSVR